MYVFDLGHWCKNCKFAHLYNEKMIGMTWNISYDEEDIVFYTKDHVEKFRKDNKIPDNITVKMYIGAEFVNGSPCFVSQLTIEPEDCECFPDLRKIKNILSEKEFLEVSEKVEEWLKMKNKRREDIEII